jgi:exosortase
MEYFTMRTSMIVVTGGTIIYVLGWEPYKRMQLPLLYLLLMVPIPVIIYDSMTMPLKLFVAKVSVKGLVAFGYPVLREGNIIMLPNITLEVADACSGLRSLMSLIALSVAFAFLTQRGVWKKWVLILSALPVAVITNILRVFGTGVLAKHYGSVAAEGFFHEFAGFMVFFVAMVIMALIGWVLKLGEKRHES